LVGGVGRAGTVDGVARIRVSTMLDAPPSVVWADLEDLSSHPEWMADAVRIRFLTERTTGVGTRFECDTKIGPFRLTDVMEITEWSRGKAMGVTHTGLVTGTGRFTLKKARGGRTRFQWKERLRYPIWLGGPVGAFASKPLLAWVWRRSMRNLQQRF
jgi:Polyketide cyclase / dehydrase and lipid transport